MLSLLLTIAGILVLIQVLHKVYIGIYEIYFMKGFNLVERYGKGSTVVITGGSDGIGLAYAHKFASQGFNLVLIAQTLEKLQKRAEQILDQYPNIQIQTIATDLSKNTSSYYNELLDEIKLPNVSILINCAGIKVGQLASEPLERLRDSILVNGVSAMMLTRNFIFKYTPELPTRKAIINISTHCEQLETSVNSIYNSVKTGVWMFSVGEAQNYKDLGYDMLVVKPVNVSTGMTGYRATDFLTETPEAVVESSLKALGNVDETHGTVKHVRYGLLSEQVRYFFGMGFANFWHGFIDFKAKGTE
jgi:17beta-estradiol 17-dehydrogenase / very-long-chain 3-oxoacyl-CoA reductase